MNEWGWIAIIILIVLLLRSQSSSATQLHNEETWEWTDWRGNQRKMTVYRNVGAS
jgi:hypothetical protein